MEIQSPDNLLYRSQGAETGASHFISIVRQTQSRTSNRRRDGSEVPASRMAFVCMKIALLSEFDIQINEFHLGTWVKLLQAQPCICLSSSSRWRREGKAERPSSAISNALSHFTRTSSEARSSIIGNSSSWEYRDLVCQCQRQSQIPVADLWTSAVVARWRCEIPTQPLSLSGNLLTIENFALRGILGKAYMMASGTSLIIQAEGSHKLYDIY